MQGTELRQVGLLDSIQRRTKSANAVLPVPVQSLTDNGGYVLAPSQTQAAVAAVLRNGYMTHKQTAEEGLLSIDLSSERVRKAIWLIEGVQRGQSLNALLGYLFEDAMHDQHLDKYIQAFRDMGLRCAPHGITASLPPVPTGARACPHPARIGTPLLRFSRPSTIMPTLWATSRSPKR